MMMWRLLLVAGALLLSAGVRAEAPAALAPAWDYAGDSQGTRLWTRQLPGHPVKDFRAQMTVDAPLAVVVAALTDVNAFPQWFWMMREAKLVGGTTLDDAHFYFAMHRIWPVAARDAVVRTRVSQDPQTLAVSIHVTAEPGRLPAVADHVRIPVMMSGWKLTPLSKTQTQLELVGHADPGGHIPLWLANSVVTMMPKETFRKLRRYLADPRYRNPEALYPQNPMLRDLMGRIRLP